MPMVKNKTATTPAPVAAAAPAAEAPKAAAPASTDSGTKAAIGRLQKKTETTTAPAKTEGKYVGRDFDKEARGKSLCLLYGHAIGSALIAGTKFEDLEGAFQNMKFFVDRAMKEIFAD